jgi:hypothetical protein
MAWRGYVAGLVVLLACAHQPLVAQSIPPSLQGGRQLAWPVPRFSAGSLSTDERGPAAGGTRDAPLHAVSPGGALHARSAEPGDGLGRVLGEAGRYRTLCVRTCDGYYFPLSFAIPRSGFARDADVCTANCGSQARLFYHANPGGDVDSMVDLAGRAYIELPTAFVYRRTLVDGCRCRPQPWSQTELDRHRSYAEPSGATPSMASSLAQPVKSVSATAAAEPGAGEPALALDGLDDGHLLLARPEPRARGDLPHRPAPWETRGAGSRE